MYCHNCGKYVDDNLKYCPNCGAPNSFGAQARDSARNAFHSAENQIEYAVNDFRGTPNPSGRLQTDRSLLMYILLSLITCGIYSYYFIYKIAKDVNVACQGDGDDTGGLVQYILLSFITCGIYSWYWEYKLGNRLATNAQRYGMQFQENGTTIIMWCLFGILLCGIGPFIAMNIIIKNTNSICAAYNRANGL